MTDWSSILFPGNNCALFGVAAYVYVDIFRHAFYWNLKNLMKIFTSILFLIASRDIAGVPIYVQTRVLGTSISTTALCTGALKVASAMFGSFAADNDR